MESSTSVLSYYLAAASRSWSAAWSWATGQGIILTWLLAFGVLFVAIAFAVVRAWRKDHSWKDAVKHAGWAFRDFLVAGVLSSGFVLALLFAVFFVRDAPTQLAESKHSIEQLKADHQKELTTISSEYEAEAGALKKKIADLESKLDDRDTKRREREDQARIKGNRIAAISSLISGANVIAKTFESGNDKDLIRTQYLAWEQSAISVLESDSFGVSYLPEFGTARGNGMMLVDHNIEGNGWYSLLESKIRVLNSFMTELRKQ